LSSFTLLPYTTLFRSHHCLQIQPNAVQYPRPDLLEDDAIGNSEIGCPERKRFHDLFAWDTFTQIESVQNDGRRDANHNEHDLREDRKSTRLNSSHQII